MTENAINNEEELQDVQEELQEWQQERPPQPYEWEVPFWFELYDVIRYDDEWIEHHTPQIRECKRTPEERIQQRIIYLRNKLIEWTITADEREELKLLIW